MTRGLMGNWTFDIQDDFTLPSGLEGTLYDTSDIERTHKDFAMKCKTLSLSLIIHHLKLPNSFRGGS